MSQKTVLIAEDEKPMAKALELKLKSSGFDAHAVFNGEEVFEFIEKKTPDLILLDLMMPKMDGFEVLEQMKEKGIKAKVIVSSNLSQDEDMKRAEGLGAVGYFVKSNTSISEVVDKVMAALT